MHKIRATPPSCIKNYIKSPDQRENDKYPEISPEDTEICNLNDREFKIAIIKKLNELQENSDRQFNEIRNKINEQREFFTKEIETIKKTDQKCWR